METLALLANGLLVRRVPLMREAALCVVEGRGRGEGAECRAAARTVSRLRNAGMGRLVGPGATCRRLKWAGRSCFTWGTMRCVQGIQWRVCAIFAYVYRMRSTDHAGQPREERRGTGMLAQGFQGPGASRAARVACCVPLIVSDRLAISRGWTQRLLYGIVSCG